MVDIEILRNLIPLNELNEDMLKKLAGQLKEEPYPAGAVLCEEGDPENTSIYLIEGGVELTTTKTTMRRIVQGGTSDANFAIAQERPRTDTITATTGVRIIRVDNARLDRAVMLDELTTTITTLKSKNKKESDNEWVDRMLNTDAFSQVPQDKLGPILLKMEGRHIKNGDTVISQEQPGQYYYVIKKGQFNVCRKSDAGVEIIANLDAGDVFGEESLISGLGANASVIATSDATVMRLAKSDFDELLKEPLMQYVDANKAGEMVKQGSMVIDVRTPAEYKKGSLRGSVNIPLVTIREGFDKLKTDKSYVLCCRRGIQSEVAAFLMRQKGFDVFVLKGGLATIAKKPKS
ncbi:MAG: cyclic nucleotide-binding domain-containing protein [Proteobacteria bacterium]|nr:cyclic nucleotide-binding domain-containing protein [Pseudomonadota bacterium]